jgi:hypothetical protein
VTNSYEIDCNCSRGGNADTCECREFSETTTPRHVLEVTARPYSAGSPRRYFAGDYQIGAVVDNSGATYVVRDFGGVLMFDPVAV